MLDQRLATLRDALGETGFDAAWTAGRMLAPDRASEEALMVAAR